MKRMSQLAACARDLTQELGGIIVFIIISLHKIIEVVDFFHLNNILFHKNGLDSRLEAYNKSSPCVSRVSNTKVGWLWYLNK